MSEPNRRSAAGIQERGTSDVTIGLLHPGEMGAAVGQCLVGNGYPVLWTPEGRSAATAARAQAAGLTAADGLADLAGRADIIISVCPPHAALDVAAQVAGTAGSGGPGAGSAGQPTRLGGIFVDANATATGPRMPCSPPCSRHRNPTSTRRGFPGPVSLTWS